ncbi:MAG: alpha-mannosidase, partial [Phycisphaerales bacterium]|nr:alpha-mannosidase [Phycisphaerales bacterium]
DPAKGGTVSSLFVKGMDREFVRGAGGPRRFNELRGYFSAAGAWWSSADAAATVTVTEPGPIRATVRIEGTIGPHPFATELSVAAGRARIDVRTTVKFPIGRPTTARPGKPEPFAVGASPPPAGKGDENGNRRAFFDSRPKLQALFPVTLDRPTLDKSAPFDVCRTAHADAAFDTWLGAKHNVIVDWVDAVAGDGSAGLAVMTDHTTEYHHGAGEPLGLVLGYAGGGVWRDYPMDAEPTAAYAIVPHGGDWRAGRLWRERAEWAEPLVAAAATGPGSAALGGAGPGAGGGWSLLDGPAEGLDVPAVHVRDGRVEVRLFHTGYGGGKSLAVRLARPVVGAELVELDGRVIADLPIWGRGDDGTIGLELPGVPMFGVRTLRLRIGATH